MKKGWETKKLGEIIQLEYGRPLADSERNPNGLYPAYGANGVKDRTDKFYKGAPSIIVGRKGSAGEVTLTEEKYWPLDVTFFVEFDRAKYDLQYLYILLLTLNLPSMAKGVKPGINRNDVYDITVTTPDIEEQHRIVTLLDEAFADIATAKANAVKNLQNARELFESHLQAAFTQQAGWELKTFGELAEFRNGINFTKSSKGNEIKIVGVRDFQKNFWAPLDDIETIVPDGEIPASDLIESGDLLFVRSNGNPELIGRSLLIGDLHERITHSGFTIKARLRNTELNPIYLCHYLKTGLLRREMIEGGNGANIKSLNQGTLSRLKIAFPDKLKQLLIVKHLETVQAEIAELESIYRQKLTALDDLKKSLLHQAFSGQL